MLESRAQCISLWLFKIFENPMKEKFAEENVYVDLGSDQTSLHNPWAGGYYPAGISFEESNVMMVENPALFKEKVQES